MLDIETLMSERKLAPVPTPPVALRPPANRPSNAPSVSGLKNIPIQDWSDLLSAVKARLRLTVGDRSPAMTSSQAWDAARRIQASVLECVAALDQLHATVCHEVGLRRKLELEVFDAQTALAQALAELVGAQATEKQARHLAVHDGLTQLPNRGFFRERLEELLASPERQALAVLYLDLDDFKPINDTHGHEAGDELLKIVALRLSRSVRAEDMVSRLGGDEFACLLSDFPGREQLSQVASKLYDAVSAPLQIGELKLRVRPSIGIAMCPTDGATVEDLVGNADSAMYRAKRRQMGYAFFDQRG